MKKLLLAFSFLSCVALIVGCGPKRPEGLPPLVSCVLTFQYEGGSPVADAMVSLVPENADLRQWSIAGTTNASGVATIFTHGDFAGAPAGTFRVVVRKTDVRPTGATDAEGYPVVEIHSMIAAEFSSPSRTPLSLEVGNSPVRETFTVGSATTVRLEFEAL